MIAVLRRVDDAVGKAEMAFCMLCMGVVVVSTALSVVFRYLLQSPLLWANDAGALALVWLTFVGAALLLKEGGHVAITGLVNRLPRRGLLAVGVLAALVIGASMFTIGWFAIRAAQVQWGQEIVALGLSRGFYSIPIVWAAVSSALTVVLMVLKSVAPSAPAGREQEG